MSKRKRRTVPLGKCLDESAPRRYREYEDEVYLREMNISTGGVGCATWDGAIVLAKWLHANNHILEGKTVHEPGAGVGLPGLLAARYAKRVLMTDYIDSLVDNLKYNADLNGTFKLRELDAEDDELKEAEDEYEARLATSASSSTSTSTSSSSSSANDTKSEQLSSIADSSVDTAGAESKKCDLVTAAVASEAASTSMTSSSIPEASSLSSTDLEAQCKDVSASASATTSDSTPPSSTSVPSSSATDVAAATAAAAAALRKRRIRDAFAVKRSADVKELDWLEFKNMSAEAKADLFCDVALASEVAYHQNSEAHDSLIELLSETITPSGALYLVQSANRGTLDHFAHAMKDKGFELHIHEVPPEILKEYATGQLLEQYHYYTFRRPGSDLPVMK